MSNHFVLFVIPLFLVLILLEVFIDWRRGTGFYRLNDAWGSMVLGVLSRTSKLVVFTTGAIWFAELIQGYEVFQFSTSNIWHWILAFIAWDLSYYWAHRFGHEINLFWASHAVHHQSEEFNLSTALRQTSTGILGFVFSIPMIFLGFPVEMIVLSNGLNLLYQFWVHTRLIDRLGWFEYWFVTPSHHRVHHGQNPIYLDKNYGGVFIIWDRMFKTFQEETEEVVYGVIEPTRSFEPMTANFQYWKALFRDAWRAQNWLDKIKIWFMHPGWVPNDVAERFPAKKREIADFVKYDPPLDKATKLYGIFHLLMATPVTVYFLIHFTGLSTGMIWLGFIVITLPYITVGRMMDGKSRVPELIRILVSWPLIFFAWPILALDSVIVLGGSLLIATVLYASLWIFNGTLLAQQQS